MKSKVILKADFAAWADHLIKRGRVAGIKEKIPGKYEFADLSSASELRLDYDVSVTSPKKYFQPPKETLLQFKRGGDFKLNAVVESGSLTIIGVHPYDMHAINQMDKVFAEDNRDTNYLEKRAHSTIIGVDPVAATKWSFWADMGTSVVESGYDLWLTDLGDRYFIEVATDKGERSLKQATVTDTAGEDIVARQQIRDKLTELCGPDRKLKASTKELPSLFSSCYENPLWDERAKKCYSCGSCNLVCPTCYCFDVREEVELDLVNGRRVRLWDSCLLEDFAKVGSGENFREERNERFRHRLMRKMVYMNDKIGVSACVGCGRCSSVCLPDITDPVKIINELKG